MVKKVLMYGLVLMLVCGASGTGVGLLYMATRDEISAKRVEAFVSTLNSVFSNEVEKITVYDCESQEELTLDQVIERMSAPGDKKLTLADLKKKVYIGYDGQGKRIAYAATGEAQGYQSTVELLVSVKPDPAVATRVPENPEVLKMRVVASQETPGLGENIKKIEVDESLWGAMTRKGEEEEKEAVPAFQAQFTGKRLDQLRVVTVEDPTALMAVTGATITSNAAAKASRDAIDKIVKCFRGKMQEE